MKIINQAVRLFVVICLLAASCPVNASVSERREAFDKARLQMGQDRRVLAAWIPDSSWLSSLLAIQCALLSLWILSSGQTKSAPTVKEMDITDWVQRLKAPKTDDAQILASFNEKKTILRQQSGELRQTRMMADKIYEKAKNTTKVGDSFRSNPFAVRRKEMRARLMEQHTHLLQKAQRLEKQLTNGVAEYQTAYASFVKANKRQLVKGAAAAQKGAKGSLARGAAEQTAKNATKGAAKATAEAAGKGLVKKAAKKLPLVLLFILAASSADAEEADMARRLQENPALALDLSDEQAGTVRESELLTDIYLQIAEQVHELALLPKEELQELMEQAREEERVLQTRQADAVRQTLKREWAR